MRTYLIFFGKSQDFNFYAFDENGYVDNFDNVIKDFDLLESKVFTIDDVNNKPILAKYNFKTASSKTFSLLKLYSFAQAHGGTRIVGSIYGVALLSEKDLIISESNNKMLIALLNKFSELSLSGVKFNKSDFKADAHSIWQAYKNNNYYNVIELNGNPIVSENGNPMGFYTPNLLIDPASIGNQIENTSKLYFSEDLEHLKRTSQKWAERFTLYHQVNGKYIEYKEAKVSIPTKPILGDNEIVDKQNVENAELRNNKDQLLIELNNKFEKERRIKHYLLISTASLFLVTFILALKVIIPIINQAVSNANVNTSIGNVNTGNTNESKIATPIPSEKTYSNGIEAILDDPENSKLLQNLLVNIKEYKKKPSQNKYYDAIKRDAGFLGIDVSFIEKYKPENKSSGNNRNVNVPSQQLVRQQQAAQQQKKTLTKQKPTQQPAKPPAQQPTNPSANQQPAQQPTKSPT